MLAYAYAVHLIYLWVCACVTVAQTMRNVLGVRELCVCMCSQLGMPKTKHNSTHTLKPDRTMYGMETQNQKSLETNVNNLFHEHMYIYLFIFVK